MGVFFDLIAFLSGIFIDLFVLLGWRDKKQVTKGCAACHELKNTNHITDHKQLTHAIRKIRKQIALHSFKEVTQPPRPHPGTFLKLPVTPPWPEHIEHRFKCLDCGKQYRLHASTCAGKEPQAIQGQLLKQS